MRGAPLSVYRALLLIAATFSLAGCVLQARVPLFGDSESSLALGSEGGRIQAFSKTDGSWTSDGEPVELKVEGRHYVAVVEEGFVTFHFMPLQDTLFVMQATARDNPAVYGLAEVKGRAVDISFLSCGDLKRHEELSAWVDFEGEDCFVKPGAPVQEVFATLAQYPWEPTSRLEILP